MASPSNPARPPKPADVPAVDCGDAMQPPRLPPVAANVPEALPEPAPLTVPLKPPAVLEPPAPLESPAPPEAPDPLEPLEGAGPLPTTVHPLYTGHTSLTLFVTLRIFESSD